MDENEDIQRFDSAGAAASSTFEYQLASAFNKALSLGVNLPIENRPLEFVFVGGQSSGKSSLVESCIGFECNYISSGCATRRPIMLQLVRNVDAKVPICRFVDDNGNFSAVSFSPAKVRDELERRSKEIPEGMISDSVIQLNIEYAHTTTMNIFDVPGFRAKISSEDEESGISRSIETLALDLISEKSRKIVYIEPACVGFANSLWIDLIRRVDPKLSRTIIVLSKMDEKMEQFSRDKESPNVINSFLKGDGFISDGAQAFFVSMPKQRGVEVSKFPTELRKANDSLLESLSRMSTEQSCLKRVGIQSFLEFVCKTSFSENAKRIFSLIESMRAMVRQAQSNITSNKRIIDEADTLPQKQLLGIMSQLRLMCSFLHFGAAAVVQAGVPNLRQVHAFMKEKFGQNHEQEMGESVDIVANGSASLYGREQAERILEAIKGSLKQMKIPDLTEDVINELGYSDVLVSEHLRSEGWSMIVHFINRSVEIMRQWTQRSICSVAFSAAVKNWENVKTSILSSKAEARLSEFISSIAEEMLSTRAESLIGKLLEVLEPVIVSVQNCKDVDDTTLDTLNRKMRQIWESHVETIAKVVTCNISYVFGKVLSNDFIAEANCRILGLKSESLCRLMAMDIEEKRAEMEASISKKAKLELLIVELSTLVADLVQ